MTSDESGDTRCGGTPPTWPSHVAEVRGWVSGTGRGPKEDRMLTEVTVSLPPMISELRATLPPGSHSVLDEGMIAVARLDAEFGDRLASFGRFLIRTEAVSSSKIEFIEASVDDYARAMVGIKANESATSMVAATDALTEMVQKASESGLITEESVLAAHRTLLKDDAMDGQYAGTYRTVQNWLGGSNHSPRNAVHVPPPPESVPGYMADLFRFVNRDDIHPVVQAAIAHAQFESIHPFTDGNGRIGRALITAIYRRRRLTTTTVTPVASALVADQARYFELLNAYRAGHADPFVLELAAATIVSSREARISATRFEELPGEWRVAVPARDGSAVDVLLDSLLDTPVLTSEVAERLVGGPASSVFSAIDRLVEARVVHAITDRKRNRVWVVTAVMDELDDLALRIRQAVVADRAAHE
jgi:Fic family protein